MLSEMSQSHTHKINITYCLIPLIKKKRPRVGNSRETGSGCLGGRLEGCVKGQMTARGYEVLFGGDGNASGLILVVVAQLCE